MKKIYRAVFLGDRLTKLCDQEQGPQLEVQGQKIGIVQGVSAAPSNIST